MFNLDIIELVNEFKNSTSDYDKNRFKSSLINLISENKDKYDDFLKEYSTQVDKDTMDFLVSLENEIKGGGVDSVSNISNISNIDDVIEDSNIVNVRNDVSTYVNKKIVSDSIGSGVSLGNNSVDSSSSDNVIVVKNYYVEWEKNFNSNSNFVNDRCRQIVEEIVSKYVENEYGIIDKMLNIDNGDDFDSFKWHIKNTLKVYYATKVGEYIDKLDVGSLSFFQKIKKKSLIESLLKDIGKYKFDRKRMSEVLK